MRNPMPFLREYPRVTAQALRAAKGTGDHQLLADAARMRRDALLDRIGVQVRPQLFGRPIACSNVRSLAFAFQDVVLSGHYAVDLGIPGPRIIDCGANIGLSVLYFHHRYPGARITAFEPAPGAFQNLKHNTAGIDHLRLECAAVGGRDSKMEMWIEDDSMHAGAYHREGVTQRAMVPVKRLSPYIDQPVDLLKLDVEGAESDVLHELEASRALGNVKAMVVEFHHNLGPPHLGAVLSLLERAGFGYQLATQPNSPIKPVDDFEDIHIYARRLS
jgi:FkbM family methyltransferase